METMISSVGSNDDLTLETCVLVKELNEIFGPTVVAAIAGTRDTKAPIRWAKPGSAMRAEPERRLRFGHRTCELILTGVDERVAKAWFTSSNPLLGERTPIEAMDLGKYLEVTNAAKVFVASKQEVSERETGVSATLNPLGDGSYDAGKPAATMKDVAELAGVSIKTVSNVVNESAKVSDKTRQRVEVAVRDLGYQMNFSARSLRQGRTGMIGLILPELRVPYFAELADSVLKAAESHGLALLIEQTGSIGEHERDVLRSPRRRFTDGVLFSPVAMDPSLHPELEVDYPLVLLGERVFDPKFDHVTMANIEGSQLAVEHLAAAGCKNIAVLGYHEGEVMGSAALRFQGYRKGLESAGLKFDPRLLGGAGRWVRSTGKAAMEQVLASGVPVDGVFAMNDALALGALPALRAAGLRVPEDVLVVGFDDIDDAQYSDPPLTSIDPGRDEIATRAVALLVDKMAGKSREPEQITAGFKLVERESSRAF